MKGLEREALLKVAKITRHDLFGTQYMTECESMRVIFAIYMLQIRSEVKTR